MAKAKGLMPRLAHAEEVFLRQPPVPLTHEDRAALRAFFDSQAFKRAWAIAKLSEPSVVVAADAVVGGLNGPQGAVIANNRFHELRGWKFFEAALLKQLADPMPVVPRAQETWPDSGLDIVDPSKLPKSPPPAPLPLHPKPPAKT